MTTDRNRIIAAPSRTGARSSSPHRLLLGSISLSGLAALFIVAGTPGVAAAANGCIQGGSVVSNCTLDANFVGTVTIAKSGVTLDCNSFRIAGPGKTANAITVNGVRDVTVKNCLVQNGANGVDIENSRYVKLINNSLRNNWGPGVKINNSADVSLLNSEVKFNQDDGMELDNSYNIIVQNVLIEGNNDEGIDLDSTDNVYIYSVTVKNNGVKTDKGGDGIGSNNSSYVSILFSNFFDNHGRGVDIKGGYKVTVQYNTFSGNVKGPYRDDGLSRSLNISSNTLL